MDIGLFWKLLDCGREYGERECKRINFDGNTTNAKICLYLLAHPGVSQYDIAFAYHMEASTVAKSLARLEKEKLVIRRVNPRDKRARIVSLTKAGEKAYEEVRRIQENWALRVSESLSEEENTEIDRLVKKALAGAERIMLFEDAER